MNIIPHKPIWKDMKNYTSTREAHELSKYLQHSPCDTQLDTYFFFTGHSTFSSTRIIWLTTPYWIPKWQITHQSVSNTRDIRIHSIYLLFPCEHILLSLSFLWHYVQLLNGFLLLCGCDDNEVGWSSGMCNILHKWCKY